MIAVLVNTCTVLVGSLLGILLRNRLKESLQNAVMRALALCTMLIGISSALETQRLLGKNYSKPPFPVDPDHPYYAENPCKVITALETNTPTYFDAINIRNNGAVGNLPDNVILDVPGLAIGGEVRSIHVGDLPAGPAELCRRQTVLHEMIVQACADGNDNLAVQALCLDP